MNPDRHYALNSDILIKVTHQPIATSHNLRGRRSVGPSTYQK